jgi:hypothetical protein
MHVCVPCFGACSNPSLAEMAAELLRAGRSTMRQAIDWLKQGNVAGVLCLAFYCMRFRGGCLHACLSAQCGEADCTNTPALHLMEEKQQYIGRGARLITELGLNVRRSPVQS